MSSKPILFISGATGNFGKVFLGLAQESSLFQKYHVRAGTSSADKIPGLEKSFPQVEWILCDLENCGQVCSALKGAETFFLIPGGVENRDELGVCAIQCAKKQGVKKTILFSVAGCDSADILFARQFRKMEVALESSGMKWNHLRTIWFQENVFGWISYIKEGRFPLATGDGKFPWMNLMDAAEAAAVLLVNDDKSLENQAFTITGPELLSGADVAKIMSEKLGKEIKYEALPPEQELKVLVKVGFPEWQAKGSLELMDLFEKNLCAFVSPDFKKLTGRDGTKFSNWFETVTGVFNGEPKH